MEFIPENHMAFDAADIGLPSISACQAICVQTSRGLYGFHDLKAGADFIGKQTSDEAGTEKIARFADWIKDSLNMDETIITVQGFVNASQQYNASTDGNLVWAATLTKLASSFGFTAPVISFRLSIGSHLKNTESAYVKFSLAGGNLSVGYKRWSKMKEDNTAKNAADPAVHQMVRRPHGGAFGVVVVPKAFAVAPVIRQDPTKGENLNMIALRKGIVFQ
ncbi:MAG: hypothetical protein QNK92_12375 [Amylibacter sp.]